MEIKALLQSDYIPAADWQDTCLMLSKTDDLFNWLQIKKVSVKKIKVDKSLLDYPNDVNEDEVTYMLNNFYEDAWEPIFINENYFLLDGQHRLRLAQRIGLKYIDVVMKKRKDPEVTKKMRKTIQLERKYQKEMKRIFGFAL